MLTRRHLLVCTAMTGLLLAAGPSAWAQSVPDATGFVVKLGTDLVAIVNSPGDLAEKRKRLTPIIETGIDVDGIARFCLGRYWRTATPEQQQAYSALFHDVLLNNISSKLGQYQGVTFAPTSTTQRDSDILVGTVISRPNQQPNTVQWVVNQVGGRPRVIDVVAEGTSLRLTQRSDYAAYLSRNNNSVDALISAMKQQLAG
jgi:phospholipid transport system substrate-binding protein